MQPTDREHARLEMGPPDLDGGPEPRFGPALRAHWRLMLAIIGGLALLAIAYGAVRTPNYEAETRLAVGGLNASPSATLTGFSTAAQQLAETYSRSIQGDAVVDEVAKKLNTTPAQVRPQLSAAPIPETPVFNVTATTKSSASSVDMSRIASAALVREVNRASDATPGRLLSQYQRAESQRERAERRVAALSQGIGTGSLAQARSELFGAEARAESMRQKYVNSAQGGSVPLEVIASADKSSSDRFTKLQLFVFAAVLVGFIISAALALFLESLHYPRFEESTLGRWELARRTRAQRAQARRART